MNLGASTLIKSSLCQMVYFAKKKKERKVTKAQIKGNKHAEKISKGLSQELRGTFYHELFQLFFVIDALDNNIAFEIKNIEGDYEEWFFKSSLIQSSFYFHLIKQVKYLDTPAFRKKEGYQDQFVDLLENPIDTFILQFGDISYYVEDSKEIFNHYINKAKKFINIVDCEWEEALYLSKKWDAKYKFKEVDLFKVNYQKLETPILTL